MSRSLIWYLRRHPLLYEVRFRLLSKNVTIDRVENFCYNNINKTTDIPDIYFELNPLIFEKIKIALSDLDKAKRIAIWLRNNIKGGPGLGKSSEMALRKMINGEGGVCSDFSQVFNNFCVINDLKVKEWGLKVLSKDPTLNGGHAFNEVYSKEFQKWILIDVSKSLLFYPINPTIPLSIFDLVNLKNENEKVKFSCFNENTITDNKRITDIYITSNSSPFLITNYCNKTYDFYLDKLNFLPEPIVHGLLFLLGKSYAFEFPKYQ
ncbi:transglutaminase-like domain-containing protein [Flavobacterium gawalongense]|uniref:Transglutaminase domain-containing protein n=1 Tax=Flavobacterium gawalongense TaxID=2594432 RepID=A0A553BVB3_9FLAO|nr:transglutaminase-like domain-containing protein [Flavobacterium gawalongense]TRX02725.1 transglutaminase domain-containing protein [Flavobacterium gawalongense]TRX08033.1 transglutaminase domain-containing protein [Flavobacterium gawalongense]TRX10930.1 transglutaminase domain-containing protein [Flavobacterium gawalongense]TRX12176.1 transglutaminase domain-containing protein [Flavobacterium gawalongense]TRX25156.1 transglutaminase domain-containing protein [Flavobacterium gawalongense]